MKTTSYYNSEYEIIFREDLQNANRETQLDVMRTWFEQYFENPAERTPYESEEGGYQWIWGGPYDARDELKDEFSEIVPDDVIDELAEELEAESFEWAPGPRSTNYDVVFFIDDIAQITTYYHNFLEALHNIKQLLDVDYEDFPVINCLYRLFYVNVITALETYLSDAFINLVMTNSILTRRFVETNPEFRKEKIAISDVYRTMEMLENKVKKFLIDISWHHLARIKPMYQDTLGIIFPANDAKLFQAIKVRHHIIHRNGKTKDGEEITCTKEDVKNLISEVESFVKNIDTQVAKIRDNPNAPQAPFKVMM